MGWRAWVRDKKPVALTHRQVTALAGELYRAWAGGDGRERTIAVEHAPDGGWQRIHSNHLEPEEWQATLANFVKLAARQADVRIRVAASKPLIAAVVSLKPAERAAA